MNCFKRATGIDGKMACSRILHRRPSNNRDLSARPKQSRDGDMTYNAIFRVIVSSAELLSLTVEVPCAPARLQTASTSSLPPSPTIAPLLRLRRTIRGYSPWFSSSSLCVTRATTCSTLLADWWAATACAKKPVSAVENRMIRCARAVEPVTFIMTTAAMSSFQNQKWRRSASEAKAQARLDPVSSNQERKK